MQHQFEPKHKHCLHDGCTIAPTWRVGSTDDEYCRFHVQEHSKEGEKTTPLIGNVKIKVEEKRPTQKIKAEKPGDLSQFIGKTMRMMDGQMVKIEKIQGSIIKESRFEVNNAHHIVILDAFKQLNKDKSITQEQIDAFDAIEHEVVKVPTKEGAVNGSSHAN